MTLKVIELIWRFFLLAVLAVSLILVATYLLSMGLGILVVFSTPTGLGFSRETVSFNPLLFINIDISVNAGSYFIFLWSFFVLCFVAALKNRESIVERVQQTISGTGKKSLFQNNLLAMPVIASMLLVAVLVLHFLQSLGGISTGEPVQTEPFIDFLRFSRAPVVEEIVFRIIPIGAFLVTFVPLAGRKVARTLSGKQRVKLALLSVLYPDKAKNMVDLKTIDKHGLLRGTMWVEWVMIVSTAIVFGAAHYTGDPNSWQIGKISQAALSGGVFAVAYLYYGVQAPVLLHWFFNYYFTVFDLTYAYFAATDLASFIWLANLSFGIFLWLTLTVIGAVIGVLAIYERVYKRASTCPL